MADNDTFRSTAAPAIGGPVETTSYRETVTAPVHTQSLDTAVPASSHAHPRISWGAIFAGAVMALVAQLAFSLLGIGIGANALNPYDNDPAGGLGMGAAIWTLVSVLISLFTGGYVAGRLAGMPRAQDSMLHGLVTFGLTSLLGVYLLTSGIGKVIGGAGSLVSSVVSSATSAAGSAAPGLADSAKDKLKDNGIDISDIQGQVDLLLRQTGMPALQPENLQNRAQSAGDQAQNTAQNAAQEPNAANTDVKGLVNKVFGENQDLAAQAKNREALVNVIMSRTGKTRPEAEQIVNNYQQTYEQAKAKAKQLADEAKQKALAAADDTRKAAAKGGLAASLALLLGAIAAAIGGRSATPRDMTEVATMTPRTVRR